MLLNGYDALHRILEGVTANISMPSYAAWALTGIKPSRPISPVTRTKNSRPTSSLINLTMTRSLPQLIEVLPALSSDVSTRTCLVVFMITRYLGGGFVA